MDYLQGIVEMVGHIAWPTVTIIIVIIFREELLKILTALKERIEDKNSNISITNEGLEIKSIEARLVSLQVDQDQVKSLALQNLEPASLPESGTVDNYTVLKEMADNYLNIKVDDYQKRIKAKNIAVEEMAFYIVANKINKDRLAKEKHEGLLVALSRSIILSPEIGDAKRLLEAAHGAKRLHVKYQVLIAIVNLVERNLFQSSDLEAVRKLLSDYEEGADSPLKRLISNVKSLVNLSNEK